MVNFDLSGADEASQVRVGVGGGVEGAGGLFEIGDKLLGFIDVWHRAAGGAGDAADHALGAALA